MPAMIAFRLLQGVGAACIQPVSLTIIADYYPISERGKVQGYLASVWAISAVLGPMLGGLIIRDLSWAWIFWINIPIGLLAALGFVLHLHEEAPRQRPSIDVLGAGLFTVAVAGLMIALTDANAFTDTHVWAGVLVCVIASLLFVWQERRARDPMISFALWSRRPIAAANAATLLSGMVLMGLTTFLPMYAQGVLRQTPVVAGMALTMLFTALQPFSVSAIFVIVCLAFAAFGQSVAWPNVSALISRNVDWNHQGQYQGLNNAVGALARLVGPFIAALAFSGLSVDAPFFVAALLVMPAIFLAWSARNPRAPVTGM